MAEPSDPSIWSTWEDLLLAFAVRRHGSGRWDSIAAELRPRSPSGHLLTPRSCRLRFLHLHRRFSPSAADSPPEPAADVPWLEDLRRLRVAELRREVHRSDASIMSLQSKVKRLKEERERSEAGDTRVDPEEEKGTAGESPADGSRDPDRISGRSSNESNSADPKEDGAEPAKEVRPEPDPLGEGSYDGSTETGAALRRESVAESKESGDAQSSASLTRRRRRTDGGRGGGETKAEMEEAKPAANIVGIESQPLAAFLEIVMSDEYGSLFVRRLESQKSARYRRLIRRHVDLEMVGSKLKGGCYASAAGLFRDLLLLCTNAAVFFSKTSPEYIAAVRLRSLVTAEMSTAHHTHPKENTPPPPRRPRPPTPPPPPAVAKSKPKPDPGRLMPLEKSMPLVACRRRSSISTAPTKTTKEEKQEMTAKENEEDQKEKAAAKGIRTNKSRGSSTSKSTVTPVSSSRNTKKGSNSAASFLDRIKRSSSPVEEEKKFGRREQAKARAVKQVVARKSMPARRGVGRPPKRGAAAPLSAPPAKKTRETVETKVTKTPAKKRRRR